MPASPAVHANPWLAESAEIAGITPELDGVATYHLKFRDPAIHKRYRFLPGQFNMLYLPGIGEVAISVSAANPERDTWDHTIRVAGNVTRALAGLGVGGSLGLRGPYGSCWPLDECLGADLVFVAGGIGLAPLRPAIYASLDERGQFSPSIASSPPGTATSASSPCSSIACRGFRRATAPCSSAGRK
jgi:NAD(P)H-flavin reductase